jgi:PAS domain S-box-containing protein
MRVLADPSPSKSDIADIASPEFETLSDVAAEPADKTELLEFVRRASDHTNAEDLLRDAVDSMARALHAEYTGIAELDGKGANLLLKISPVAPQDSELPGKPPRVLELPLSADGQGKLDSIAAYAFLQKQTVVVSDLAEERRFSDPYLCKLGFASAITLPLFIDSKPIGAIGLYSTKPGAFQPDVLRCAEAASQIAAIHIDLKKTRAELHRQQALNSAMSALTKDMFFTLDADGNLIDANPASEKTTGFSLRAIQGRPFCNLFIQPRELNLFESMFHKAACEKIESAFESDLITKHGRRTRVAWTVRPIRNADNELQSVIMCGNEVADQEESSSRDTRTKNHQEPAAEIDLDGPDELVAMRRAPRKSYRYTQWIALITGPHLPKPGEFMPVQCRDLSASGIGFYMNSVPAFDKLVVAVGREPDLKHFSADVVRVEEKNVGGKMKYLIGCRFTGIVNLSGWEG